MVAVTISITIPVTRLQRIAGTLSKEYFSTMNYRLFHEGIDLDLDSSNPLIASPSFPLVRDVEFIKLMNLCFLRADTFSMTRARWDMTTDLSLENELKPFFIRAFETSNWFCYRVPESSPIEVRLYRADEKSEKIILKYFREPFLSRCIGENEWVYGTQTLEDLCFFSEGRLFYGTVTHEKLCYVFPKDKVFENYLKSSCYWIPTKDAGIGQIDLSQC